MEHNYCQECMYAKYDYYEYYGGHKQWFVDGCRKETEPYYDSDNECITCDCFKRMEEL